MRIDLALKYLCLARSRSNVKQLCDDFAVLLNGRAARPSATLHDNDRVTIERRSGRTTYTILRVPDKQLSKAVAREYYRVDHGSRKDNDTDRRHRR
jgi:ribosomal 50S subunit-recycling heat shock protein